MMIKWKAAIVFLLIGISLGWVGSVARYGLNLVPFPPPLGPPPGGPPPLSASTMRAAKLSEDQIQNILKVQETGREKMEAAIQKVKKAKTEFEEAVDSTQDIEILKARFQNLMEAKKAVDEAHFEIGTKVHATMTLEQSKVFRKQMMKQGFPPGQPRPPEGN